MLYYCKKFAVFAAIFFIGSLLIARAQSFPLPDSFFGSPKEKAEFEKLQKELERAYNYSILQKYPELIPYFNPETGQVNEKKFMEDLPKMQEKAFIQQIEALTTELETIMKEREQQNLGPLQIEPYMREGEVGIVGTNVELSAKHPDNPKNHYFSWHVNDKLFAEGFGKDRISFKSPPQIGAKTNVRLTTTPSPAASNQRPYETRFEITAADIDVNYEGINYVPAEYKGKKLASYKSRIVLDAAPYIMGSNGAFVDKSLVYYTWELSGSGTQTVEEGYGKSTITVPQQDAINVKVTAEHAPSNTRVTKRISPITASPEIVLTKVSKKRAVGAGVARRETIIAEIPLAIYQTNGGELLELKATPYFFGITNLNQMSFDWSYDEMGEEITIAKEKTDIAPDILKLNIAPRARLRPGMVANVFIEAVNTGNIGQTAQSSLNVRLRALAR